MKLNETWVIKHKDTGVIWVASSGKSSWRAKGHAKNAWNASRSVRRNQLPKRFDNQDTYVLVQLLPESERRLEEAVKLLRECFDTLDWGIDAALAVKVGNFLNK